VLRGRELLERRWWAAWAFSWLVLVAASAVTIPFMYPYDLAEDFIDSGVVVGLCLPILVAARILREGPVEQVLTAARPLWGWRLGAGFVFTTATVAVAAVAGLAIPVNHVQLVLDSFVLVGAGLTSAGVLGARGTWVGPVTLVTVSSAPGLLPLQYNLLYRVTAHQELALCGVALLLLGGVGYARWGSIGVVGRGHTTADARPDFVDA